MDEKEFLKSYNSNEYEKPSVAVDMVVMAIRNTKAKTYRNLDNKELQILLVKRNQHPFCDKWALPGGFCNMTETLTQAAMRVLESKTSIKNAYLEQLYTWSDVNRDPRMRIISSSYLSILNDADATILPENAAWFTVSMTEVGESHDRILYLKLTGPVTISSEIKVTASIESNIVDSDYTIIKANDLAFDHAKIIAYAIERIRNRVEYIPIVSRFLPMQFTFQELQQVYMTITNKEIAGANFRRKATPFLQETENNNSELKKGCRPAKYYKLKNKFF